MLKTVPTFQLQRTRTKFHILVKKKNIESVTYFEKAIKDHLLSWEHPYTRPLVEQHFHFRYISFLHCATLCIIFELSKRLKGIVHR